MEYTLFLWQLILVAFLLLSVFALIDIVRNKFEGNAKLMWVIIVVFVYVVGPILYFTIGRKQKKDSRSYKIKPMTKA